MKRNNEEQGITEFLAADRHDELMTVAIIEDDEYIAKYFRNIILNESRFSSVHTITDCQKALEIMREGLRPDIVLLDLGFPGGMKGIAMIDTLHEITPMTSIIVASSYCDEQTVLSVVSRSVMEYLCKPVQPEHLVLALKNAVLGLRHYSPEAERRIRDAITKGNHTPDCQHYTRQERKILPLLVEERSEKEISGMLFISVHTVHNHLTNIYRKLGVHSKQEAAAKIIRDNLLSSKV